MSEICSPTGDRSQRGTRERGRVGDGEIDGEREKDGEKQVDISVLPAHWDPFYANERPSEWTVVGRGEGSEERRED